MKFLCFEFRPRIAADDWSLIINTTTMGDSGKYECSVNTLPKNSLTVELIVKEPLMADSPHKKYPKIPPKAVISGPSVLHVSEGSTAGLECQISHLEAPPTSLYWEREGKVLHARNRPGISLEVEKVPGVSTTRLLLSNVSQKDSGMYSCASDVSSSATVWLLVSPASSVSALTSATRSSEPSINSIRRTSVTVFLATILSFSISSD